MEVSVFCGSIPGYDIWGMNARNICKCYESPIVVTSAKFVVINSLEFDLEQNKIHFKLYISC